MRLFDLQAFDLIALLTIFMLIMNVQNIIYKYKDREPRNVLSLPKGK